MLNSSYKSNDELFQKAAVPLCLIHNNNNELSINNSFVKTFGYTSAEIPTLNEWLELSLPDEEYRQNVLNFSKNLFYKAKSEERDLEPIEYKLTCKNGEIKTVLAYISFISEEYLITFIDITLRTKFNAENDLLRKAINSSSDSVFIIDMETDKFIYVNEIAYKKLGYTHDELLNLNIYELDPVLSPEQLNGIKERIQIKKGDLLTTKHKTKNGNIYPVEIQNTLYFDGERKYSVSIARDISERLKYEHEIIEREMKFRSLAETIPDNIVLYNLNSKPIYMNTNLELTIKSKFEDIKELTPVERARTMSIGEYYFNFEKNLKDVLKTGNSIEFEFIVPELLPRIVTHSVKMAPQRNEMNEIVGVLAIGRDISERKIFEEKLLESEKKFSIAFKKNPLPTIIINCEDRKIFDVNDEFIKVTGYEYNEVVGFTAIELDLYYDLSERDEMVKLLNAQGFLINYEFRSKTKDGTVRTHLNTTTVINIENKKYYLSVFQDITERKKMEKALFDAKEELLESYKLYYSILKTIPYGMDIVDKNGIILFQNDNFKNQFKESVIGMRCWEVYRDNKTQCPDCPLKGELSIGETIDCFSDNSMNGHSFNISHTGILYKGQEAVLEIFHDITEQRNFERELILAKDKAEESDKLKSAFLQNMTHEIRTPLNGIIGFSTLLKDEDISVEDRNEYVAMIEKSSNRLIEIVSNIIEISKITTGQVDVAYSEIFN